LTSSNERSSPRPPAGGFETQAHTETTAELFDLTITQWTLADFLDEGHEIVKRTNRWKWRGEGIVSRAPCGGEDEGVSEDVDGDVPFEERGGELSISATNATEHSWSGPVESDNFPHVTIADVVVSFDSRGCHARR
jgi:hypothetical protein